MKIVMTILMSVNFLISFAQEYENTSCTSMVDSLTNLLVYEIVDDMPSVNGGTLELYKEISKRIKYPKFENYLIGTRIYVAFIVSNDGKIIGQRILKNVVGTDLAEQVLNIIGEFEWNPGICNGIPVSTIQILSFFISVDQ